MLSPLPDAPLTQFINNDSGGECGKPSALLFPLPGAATAAAPYYSWAVGAVTLVAIASEVDCTEGSAQWRWLDAALAAVNRSVTPFVVVSIHRPMYIDSTYAGNPAADVDYAAVLQRHVEPLLMRHKVTACVYGHNHAVQRISAAFRNRAVDRSVPALLPDGNATALFARPRATVHFVFGTGGAGFTMNAHAEADRPEWSERVFYEWGFARLVAENATTLQVEWVCSANGSVLERATIVQDLAQPWADAAVPAANGGGGGGGASLWGAAGAGGTMLGLALVAAAALAYSRRGRMAGRGAEYAPVVMPRQSAAEPVEAWRGGAGPRR